MTKSNPNPAVDFYFNQETKWKEEQVELRKIVLASGLHEELKWGVPCYALNKKNILLIHGFKDYCALLFHKGALLKDPEGIFIQQTENVQAARQLRFSNAQEIINMKRILNAYIMEAIDVEQAGIKVKLKKTSEFKVPEEFQAILKERPELKTAFEALTPGRQRGYLLYFSSPKQSKTRVARIEKYIPQILKARGLKDL